MRTTKNVFLFVLFFSLMFCQITDAEDSPINTDMEKGLGKDLASLGVQVNWPFKIGTVEESCRVYANRKNSFIEVPAFLKGLHYTVQYRKRIMNISCRVEKSGLVYLGLFGSITPKEIGQRGLWQVIGSLKISDMKDGQTMKVYQAYVEAGQIITFNQRDTLGIVVFAKLIKKDNSRPLPKMREFIGVEKIAGGKSVKGRPIEYFVFGQGEKTLFILAAMHGDELVGVTLVHQLAEYLDKHQWLLKGMKVILLPIANPDGVAKFKYFNVNNANLNRNFDSNNRKKRGREPLSEPESKVINDIIVKYCPSCVVSIHQMMGWTIESKKSPGMVDFEGPADGLASIMSKHCGLPVERFGTQNGSLGAYVGDDLGVAIITLEIPKFDCGLDSKQLWEKYGAALVATISYAKDSK